MTSTLPRRSAEHADLGAIPRRSVVVGDVEYAARVMDNGFLMITVKDGGVQ